jgi:hypothetical protein
MAGVNANQQNNQPWMVPDVIVVPRAIHQLPKHPEKFLPKFEPDKNDFAIDHIKNFKLTIRLMDVEHDDSIYRLFPYTFENKYSTWYVSLA